LFVCDGQTHLLYGCSQAMSFSFSRSGLITHAAALDLCGIIDLARNIATLQGVS
jgi:hypothetical protein